MHRPPFYFSLVYSHRAIFVIIFRNHLNGILGIFFFFTMVTTNCGYLFTQGG